MKKTTVVICLIVATLAHFDTYAHGILKQADTPLETEQKLVYVSRTVSYRMLGDSNQYATKKDEKKGTPQPNTLPELLKQGWRVVSIHLASDDQNGTAGYVLLEKQIMRKKHLEPVK